MNVSFRISKSASAPASSRNLTAYNEESSAPVAPKKFQCALTKRLMRDPVMTVHGHNFEKEVIVRWFALGKSFCPLTGKPLSCSDTLSNRALKSQIKFWLEENDSISYKNQLDWSRVDVSSELMNVGLFTQSPKKKEESGGSKKGGHSSKPKSFKNLLKVAQKANAAPLLRK